MHKKKKRVHRIGIMIGLSIILLGFVLFVRLPAKTTITPIVLDSSKSLLSDMDTCGLEDMLFLSNLVLEHSTVIPYGNFGNLSLKISYPDILFDRVFNQNCQIRYEVSLDAVGFHTVPSSIILSPMVFETTPSQNFSWKIYPNNPEEIETNIRLFLIIPDQLGQPQRIPIIILPLEIKVMSIFGYPIHYLFCILGVILIGFSYLCTFHWKNQHE